MNLWTKITGLIQEPPPEFVFEISEGGIAWARRAHGTPAAPEFRPFAGNGEPVLAVSPLKDNVLRPETLAAEVRALAPPNGNKKKRVHRAALVLPDYCARISVMDFDQFPGDAAEQLSLVRFRMKRSVPFDVEQAALSYFPQKPAPGGGAQKVDVVVVVVALEILARYEAPFRALGLHPGYVTTSSLAGLDLLTGDQGRGISLLAKLSGRVLTVMVLDGTRVKLVRCVELDQTSEEEILAVIHPTLAYVEDELGTRPQRMTLCGFGGLAGRFAAGWADELNLAVEPLRARRGAPGEFDAGLLGVLEAMEA